MKALLKNKDDWAKIQLTFSERFSLRDFRLIGEPEKYPCILIARPIKNAFDYAVLCDFVTKEDFADKTKKIAELP